MERLLGAPADAGLSQFRQYHKAPTFGTEVKHRHAQWLQHPDHLASQFIAAEQHPAHRDTSTVRRRRVRSSIWQIHIQRRPGR